MIKASVTCRAFKEAMNYVVSQKGNFLIQELNDKADAQTAMFSL